MHWDTVTGFRPESCLLATGLCSVSGILPDLDSDSGVPYRESVAFISAFIPLLLIQRFQHLGWSRENIVLAAALIYIGMRFGVAEIFRRYTVHRGMWHSLPAAASVGLLTFLISDDQNLLLRGYWTSGRGGWVSDPSDPGRALQRRFSGRAIEEVLWHGAQAMDHPRNVAQHLDLRQAGHPDRAGVG